MSPRLVREPWWSSALSDLLRLTLLLAVCLAAGVAASVPPLTEPLWFDIPLRILIGLCAELLALTLLRAVVPKARPGAHRIGWNADYLRWLLSTALNDVAWLPILRAPFTFFRFGRVLYLKLLGADVPWQVSLPDQLTVRDPSLWVVGAGVQLEPGVVVESALHGAGRVRVGRVVVGAGCLIGAHTVLMPGAVVAHEARIGPRVLIGEDAHIGVGVTIESAVQVERGADVGSYATVGGGAILGPGAHIGDRAKVAAGAFIEPDSQIGEREHWTAIPAHRRV